MTSIQPGLFGALILGVLIVVIAVVVALLAVTGSLYILAPGARRFIKKDQPLWWVRDILIALLVAVLVLFGQSYLVSADGAPEQRQAQDQDQDQDQGQGQGQGQLIISDLNFVRFKSSESYQPRPFRGFDLRGMNLAGLKLRGADFAQANLGGANLVGTNLSAQVASPAAPDRPATPGVSTFLQGVNFCHAVLTGADLRYSLLINANLTGADLTFAQLQDAALNGSDLTGATLPSDNSYLAGIYYDDNTIWPEGFEPPPSATANKLDFLKEPLASKLYGDIQRPACNS